MNFRETIAGLALACLLGSAALADDIKVTLLGTGTPSPSPVRFSMATLVQAGPEKLLFDFGRGAPIRLTQIGVPLGDLTAHFLTHMHSDHVGGLPDVWMSGWLATPYGGRKSPLVLYGPAGTEDMALHLTEAFKEDKRIRMADEHLDEAGILFDAHDVPPGKAYEKNGVVVTAFEVHHGDLIKPAYGYRVDYDGKSVVISGDTTYDTRVAEAAKGTDLLIHEVAWIDPSVIAAFPSYKEILAHHTLPAEAGKIFTAAEPKLAVFSHIVSRGAKDQSPADVEALILEEARSTYDGPIVMGTDLMSFDITDSGVTAADAEGNPIPLQ